MDKSDSSRFATTSQISTPLIVAPLASIRPTETTDPGHVTMLADQLDGDGALFRPVHVLELDEHWLLLDGHTRRAAFERHKLKYILAQVHVGAVDTRTWAILSAAAPDTSDLLHVEADEFAAGVDSRGGVLDLAARAHYLFENNPMVTLAAQRRQVAHLAAGNNGRDLCRLEDWRRTFTRARWREEAEHHAPGTRSVLVYPTMSLERFFSMVRASEAVPCGATRFRISKIALRRGAPLEFFSGSSPVADIAQATAEIIARSGFDVEEPSDENN
jgi:hypothetical protein